MGGRQRERERGQGATSPVVKKWPSAKSSQLVKDQELEAYLAGWWTSSLESRARVSGCGAFNCGVQVCVAKQWILVVESRVSGAVVGDQKRAQRFRCVTAAGESGLLSIAENSSA